MGLFSPQTHGPKIRAHGPKMMHTYIKNHIYIYIYIYMAMSICIRQRDLVCSGDHGMVLETAQSNQMYIWMYLHNYCTLLSISLEREREMHVSFA